MTDLSEGKAHDQFNDVGYVIKSVNRNSNGDYYIVVLTEQGNEISGSVRVGFADIDGKKTRIIDYVSSSLDKSMITGEIYIRPIAQVICLIDSIS